MKNLITLLITIILFQQNAISQFFMSNEIAKAKVDSIKRILPASNGAAKVDCLNLLSDLYNWTWDFDSSCYYANKAYDEARKINYKLGITFALVQRTACAVSKVDKDTTNNSSEQAYKNAYKTAQEAIDYAVSEKNEFAVGMVFYRLNWLEDWRGTSEKFILSAQKAIQHFEQYKSELRSKYQPIGYINCSGCKGNEYLLADLHSSLGIIYARKFHPGSNAEINNAIKYAKLIGDNNLLGTLYENLANNFYIKYDYKSSEEACLKSMEFFQAAGNIEKVFRVINMLSKVYEIPGNFENGINTLGKSIRLVEEHFKNKPNGSARTRAAGQAFFWMSRLYKIAGDYESALETISKARSYYPDPIDSTTSAFWKAEMGDVHRLMGDYDSAMYYLKGFQNSGNDPNNFGKINLAYLYIDIKAYEKALALILPYYNSLKTINRITPPIANSLIIAGNAALGENNNKAALQYAREANLYLKRMDGRVLMIANYKLLSDAFRNLKNYDSAYYYLSRHTQLKDSLINRQFFFKLNSFKKETEERKRTSQIQLLKKQNELNARLLIEQALIKNQKDAELMLLSKSNLIKDQELELKEKDIKQQQLLQEQRRSELSLLGKENKLKDQQLRQQTFIRNALLGGLCLFILLGLIGYRNLLLRRRNDSLSQDKKQAEWQQKLVELEMQALRAQMNPHFIFNCLNSINRFIFMNETRVASDYLTRFSRLIRMVLLLSQKKLIPLEDELEMLKLYLEMERLRFKNAFAYSITTSNSVENETIFIPPLLLQPFCENAIWHGLMHKDGNGHLHISLSENCGILYCTIEDDGIGRKKAGELNSKSAEKQKSLGLKITQERLFLLNQGKNNGTSYEIEDLVNSKGQSCGTKVRLQIPYQQAVEEPTS